MCFCQTVENLKLYGILRNGVLLFFTVSYFLLEILRIPDNFEKRSLETFDFYDFQEAYRDATIKF